MSPADTEKESQSENSWVFRHCGTSQRNLLRWLFMVGHSRARGKSCRKLWNQIGFVLFCFVFFRVFFGSTRNLKACLRWWAKGSCRDTSQNEFLQVLWRRSIIASTTMRHAHRCALHTICPLVMAEGPDPICFSSTTKQELKYDTRFHWSSPLSSRSNWQDCMTVWWWIGALKHKDGL